MNSKIHIINGYIIAGGRSSRMGMDKGLIKLKGKAIIQYIIEQLQPLVNKLVIVSNNIEYEKFGLEVIPDLISDIGPAGGIFTALSHTNKNLNFIVGCDMPFIEKEHIEYIIKNSDHSQITLPKRKEKIEPLFGVYSKDCLIRWAELIQQDIYKLQEIILQFKLKTISMEDHLSFNDLLFININTKNDLKNAINLK